MIKRLILFVTFLVSLILFSTFVSAQVTSKDSVSDEYRAEVVARIKTGHAIEVDSAVYIIKDYKYTKVLSDSFVVVFYKKPEEGEKSYITIVNVTKNKFADVLIDSVLEVDHLPLVFDNKPEATSEYTFRGLVNKKYVCGLLILKVDGEKVPRMIGLFIENRLVLYQLKRAKEDTTSSN